MNQNATGLVQAPRPQRSLGTGRGRTSIRAFIFDVDGVIADTARLHEAAWRRLADEEGIPFDADAAQAMRGISREASARRLLAGRTVSPEQLSALMEKKNGYFVTLLEGLSGPDVLPGVRPLLTSLAGLGIKLAAASASRNARTTLARVGVTHFFEAIVDGHDAARPDASPRVRPKTFVTPPGRRCRHRRDACATGLLVRPLSRYLLAARALRVEPRHCVVVEDAAAGVAEARHLGMRCIGLGDRDRLCAATLVFESLRGVRAKTLLHWLGMKVESEPNRGVGRG